MRSSSLTTDPSNHKHLWDPIKLEKQVFVLGQRPEIEVVTFRTADSSREASASLPHPEP